MSGLARIAARQDLLLVVIVVMTVLMMILPVPTAMADAMIAVDIGIALILILLALYVRSPVEFSTLPTVILITTAFRLSISITTSRLVLVQGDAGAIIRTFGEFVIAGNVVVGLVVYLIITIVQFVVITKGSERVAEVAARFALDAMPGKQISIDTDVRNGDLSPKDARLRRSLLERESQLYGAMDGAMKFVKGDAIASLVIIAINLIGGMAIGCLQRGLPFTKAIQTYSLLAVGDGLIAQIPALLISLTAGIIVTRATAEEGGNLGEDIVGQVTAYSRPLQIAGLVLAGLGLVPGFPTILFLALGAGVGAGGVLMARHQQREAITAFEVARVVARDTPEPAFVQVRVGPSLVEEFDRIKADVEALRQELEADLGIAVPQLRLETDLALPARTAVLLVDGIPRMHVDELDAAAIKERVRHAMLQCAGQFVGIQETQALVSRIEANYGDLVREAGKAATLPNLAEVVRRLVEEQVSVANMRSVLEAVAEWGPREPSPAKLADHVRVSLARQICHRWADPANCISVLLIEGAVEEELRVAIKSNAAASSSTLDAAMATRLATEVRRQTAQRPGGGPAAAVVVTAFDTRRQFHQLLSRHGLDVPVLCHAELAEGFTTSVVGTITLSAVRADLPTPNREGRLHAVERAA